MEADVDRTELDCVACRTGSDKVYVKYLNCLTITSVIDSRIHGLGRSGFC